MPRERSQTWSVLHASIYIKVRNSQNECYLTTLEVEVLETRRAERCCGVAFEDYNAIPWLGCCFIGHVPFENEAKFFIVHKLLTIFECKLKWINLPQFSEINLTTYFIQETENCTTLEHILCFLSWNTYSIVTATIKWIGMRQRLSASFPFCFRETS